MKVEQIYTGCIAHAAYYIQSNGEAAIFDPLREVAPYINKAEADHSKIIFVFETHFHADFVSGHLDLAKKTGAKIVYGPTAKPGFEAIVAEDSQEFKVGDVTIRVIHTPGHTSGSACFLLGRNLFSGDTLLPKGPGRTDLPGGNKLELKESLLKLHVLPSDCLVYPGHGKPFTLEEFWNLGHE